MQQINCLNLCEILPYLLTKKKILESLLDAKIVAQFKTCERIYIGSSFCGKYFIQQSDSDLKEVFGLCKEKNIKVTLVIPTFSERDLELGKKRISQIVEFGADDVDEITVNDYGMLFYVRENYGLVMNLGRLIMKDYRDPRYDNYFQIPWRPKMFTNHLRTIIKDYKIKSIEMDITHKNMNFAEVPDDIIVGIHVPYCYQTVGRICEYASITKEIVNKFRVNDACEGNCAESIVKYLDSDENMEYIRYGRTIYFKHPGYELSGLDKYRLIYFPLPLQ